MSDHQQLTMSFITHNAMADQMPESNVNLSEPLHASLQREVQRKLGKCLLRLQQYELVFKELLAFRNLSGQPVNFQSILDKRVAANANKTLGMLVNDFTKDYIYSTDSKPVETYHGAQGPDNEVNPVWFNVNSSMEMSPERHAEIIQQLKELVELRNVLVHHFIERFDVSSESGCRGADLYLHECYETIDKHYLTLINWSKIKSESWSLFAAILKSPEIWTSVDAGSKP